MNKELYEYFTTDNISGKKCTEKWLSKNNNLVYQSIIDWCGNIPDLQNLEFKRKVFHYINELSEVPSCKCGNMVGYRRIRDGYSKYCSDKCVKSSDDYYEKWVNSWQENNKDGKSIKKRELTSIEKYGSIDDYKKVVRNNYEKSLMAKYGVKSLFTTNDFKKERSKILKEKYGSEKFNNPDKTRQTRINNKTQIDDSLVNDFNSYKILAINRTSTIYRNNIESINPMKLKRGKTQYHIDHIYSLKQGFLNDIPLSIITHPCNLHMIHYKENLVKQDSCWIDIKDLLDNIINYNKPIKVNHTFLKEEYNNVIDLAKKLKS